MSQPPAASLSAPTSLSPHDCRRIAVAASCDPHCVAQYVKGAPLRSTTIDRIERALRNLKFDHLVDVRAAALTRVR